MPFGFLIVSARPSICGYCQQDPSRQSSVARPHAPISLHSPYTPLAAIEGRVSGVAGQRRLETRDDPWKTEKREDYRPLQQRASEETRGKETGWEEGEISLRQSRANPERRLALIKGLANKNRLELMCYTAPRHA